MNNRQMAVRVTITTLEGDVLEHLTVLPWPATKGPIELSERIRNQIERGFNVENIEGETG